MFLLSLPYRVGYLIICPFQCTNFHSHSSLNHLKIGSLLILPVFPSICKLVVSEQFFIPPFVFDLLWTSNLSALNSSLMIFFSCRVQSSHKLIIMIQINPIYEMVILYISVPAMNTFSVLACFTSSIVVIFSLVRTLHLTRRVLFVQF